MSTIRDVAKESGLSTGTISKALKTPDKVTPENLKKIEDAISKLNYKPNMLSQKFRNKRANSIIAMVPDIANLFFVRVLSAIEKHAQKRGYSVLISDTQEGIQREQDIITMIETRLADGVINLNPYQEGNSLLPCENIFAVNSGSCSNTPYPNVGIDNIAAAKAITNHLIELGHKNIGVITGLANNPHSIDRLQGYKQALEEAGLEYKNEYVVAGDFGFESGLHAVNHFLTMQQRPSALFCMNDEMAIGAIKGLTDKGFCVPEDISVTGFDDIETASYCIPTLTTVAQPAEKIGEKSAEVLLDLIDGKHPTEHTYLFPFEVIQRGSTSVCNSTKK